MGASPRGGTGCAWSGRACADPGRGATRREPGRRPLGRPRRHSTGRAPRRGAGLGGRAKIEVVEECRPAGRSAAIGAHDSTRRYPDRPAGRIDAARSRGSLRPSRWPGSTGGGGQMFGRGRRNHLKSSPVTIRLASESTRDARDALRTPGRPSVGRSPSRRPGRTRGRAAPRAVRDGPSHSDPGRGAAEGTGAGGGSGAALGGGSKGLVDEPGEGGSTFGARPGCGVGGN